MLSTTKYENQEEVATSLILNSFNVKKNTFRAPEMHTIQRKNLT